MSIILDDWLIPEIIMYDLKKNELISLDYWMWILVQEWYTKPTRLVDGVKVETPFVDWTVEECDIAQLNSKCLNSFFCALKSKDYMRISTYKSGKDIWDRLYITYEGTNEVKQSRLNILLHDYELFCMKPNESISDNYTRFTQIVTSLHALGRELTNAEMVNKILHYLPTTYDAKITAITESKDLNIYSIDNLLGSLIAYEQGVSQKKIDAGELRREKNITLKVEESESEHSQSEDEDNIALMTRQFKSFLKRKKKRHQQWNRGKFNRNVKVSIDVICYECRKPRYIKTDCPKIKATPSKENVEEKLIMKKGKRKFQRAFWKDSTSDSSKMEKEEEFTNLCLMDDNHDQSNQEEGRSHTRPRESIYSRCSKHITGDTTQFISPKARSGGKVTFGDNTMRKVVGSDEVQLLIDYIYGLSEIGHVAHKRKKNIALGHLVAYILEKKYDLVHPNHDLEEPLYYNDGSFRAIFNKDEPRAQHVISNSEEEPAPAPTAIDVIAAIGPGYKLPSYHNIRVNLLRDCKEECRLLIDGYKQTWKEIGCTLMADGWTDSRSRTLINFLIYCPRGVSFLKSVDASDITKDASTLCYLFIGIVEWVGPESVVQIVTDNAANYKKAGQLLHERFNNIYWSPCAAHSWLRRRPGWKEIVRPGATRFATTFITLKSVHEHHHDLQALITSKFFTDSKISKTSKGKEVASIILDLKFWDNCLIISKISGPLITLLRIVDSDEKPSLGYLYDESFGKPIALAMAKEMQPDEWWKIFGSSAPNLQKVAIRVLRQTSSSSGCERNWSVFEQIHSKRQNYLEHQ
ncbi:hypothetical protein KFK09_007212 [Dendrobium nobile]|uniref:DUF659 domain-containing protein n=1 Tax=Dendrobium nobile TaxID=94219 RepID=A0A8T3BRA1_DENNO|nr:hypothetical protein KFK09_007212 [Dendrobium nobile]